MRDKEGIRDKEGGETKKDLDTYPKKGRGGGGQRADKRQLDKEVIRDTKSS